MLCAIQQQLLHTAPAIEMKYHSGKKRVNYHVHTSEIETSYNEYVITPFLFLHSSFFWFKPQDFRKRLINTFEKTGTVAF